MKKWTAIIGSITLFLAFVVQAAAEQVGGIKLDHNRRLLHAADHNDVVTVKSALRMNADANVVNNKGFTPLLFAAQKGYEDIAVILIQSKANVNAESDVKETPLWLSINGGHTNIAERLVDAGADMNNAREYIDQGKSVIRMDALLQAAEYGNVDILRMLLEKKADINKQNELGLRETALMVAAKSEVKGVLYELLLAGADETRTDIAGRAFQNYLEPNGVRTRISNYVEAIKPINFGVRAAREPRVRRPCVVGEYPVKRMDSDEYTPRVAIHRKAEEDAPPAYELRGRERNAGAALEEEQSTEELADELYAAMVLAQKEGGERRKKEQKIKIARKVVCIACPMCTYYNHEQAQTCAMCQEPLAVDLVVE